MAKTIIVVDKIIDWTSYYPAENLMSVSEYLSKWEELEASKARFQIINLCRNYKYLSSGYYCSLLAEARDHNVIPSVKTINDLSRHSNYTLDLDIEDIDVLVQKAFKKGNVSKDETISITLCFGKTDNPLFDELAQQIFDLFSCPVLIVEFKYYKKWEIDSIKAGSLHLLQSEQEDLFAKALDQYGNKIWRRPKSQKKYKYDLAILHNPEEKLPPSSKKTLKNFITAGHSLGVEVTLVEKGDLNRIAEYDALFIRETTSITHHTYRFAKRAQSEGLVVIDDPISILRCTNKVYLANLLKYNKIPAPKTHIISKDQDDQLDHLIKDIGLPLVLKIPDGSFSRGVVKISDKDELEEKSKDLFKKSALILAQEFMYTDFDWRIGILNKRAIFACKYYMSKGHWQIYNHHKDGKKSEYGNFETFPISKVPKPVLNAALKAANLIGNGLYGVDMKENNGNPYVIEVNDNPNIDAGVEDAILGDELYEIIIYEFLRRIEERGSRS